MKKISIGIPCYNEEKNIEEMYQAVTKEMEAFPQYDYEIIFEDNASKDDSGKILKKIAQADAHVKVIINQANFGVERSCHNCMANAGGDAYISIPCDFEAPPEMIPQFIRYWEEGYALVLGKKTGSKEKKCMRFCRNMYYDIINLFSDYPQYKQITGFGIYDKSVCEWLVRIHQYDPYIYTRHIIAEYGIDVKMIPYTQPVRKRGKSSYTFFSYLSMAVTSLVNTSDKPVRMITLLGAAGMAGSFICMLCAGCYKMAVCAQQNTVHKKNMNPIWILSALSFLQVFCIGILGEYVTVILRKVTRKPIVLEKEKWNFDE